MRQDIESLELVPSRGGAFEVTVNGKKVHSKLETGRYPEIEEVVAEIERDFA